MYAIYGNIYHQYTPNVSIYTYMDPMGNHAGKFVEHIVGLWMGCEGLVDPFTTPMEWAAKKEKTTGFNKWRSSGRDLQISGVRCSWHISHILSPSS